MLPPLDPTKTRIWKQAPVCPRIKNEIQSKTAMYKKQKSIKLSNYCNTVKSLDISPITVDKFNFFPIKFIRTDPILTIQTLNEFKENYSLYV